MIIILENFPCIVMQLQNSLNLNLLFQRTLKLVMLAQFHLILWEVIVIQKFCITFCISVKSCLIKKSLGFMVKRKLWNLLEIKLKMNILKKAFFRDASLIILLYEKKKEQLHMFDLVECAHYLDNTEALEYFLSMNVQTFLPNYTINKKINIIEPYNININNINNNNNTKTDSSSSSSFSLNNSNNNNYTTTVALAFRLKNSYSNNNTTTAAPEPTTFSLKNSNSNYNLNSSISEYINLNNNSTSLARSASCSSISSCNSNDSNGSSSSSGCNNKNKTLDKFHSNRADHPKITYEVIKKCLEYSNIKDIEKLFRAISTYSAGIPFNKLSISFIWKKGLICHSVTERIDKERIEKEINYNFK
ncbi:hypothetical protein DICPUDRAFT_75354 [Dictyostelium purpureum]|uniref:Uncharacterized protein n=1 Tax=Dictyostelium purpureum TaxID=5786 RepID=F0ZAG0_DICPU|nr:uncharacterized protein DICPUDRAFT_75354 [Dictyostelium purpureum]EGC39062.1 hypothetical protein DICPUDRAFT_75354 [Dictyostelium purpureum]|eukprot:XP_003284412.1 hypothetical protein DICPUDRAFT_75354 [Dictyostelium purpureum]